MPSRSNTRATGVNLAFMLAVCVLRPAAPALAQHAHAASGSTAVPRALAIRVEGDVPRPYTLTAADLMAMPRREVTAAEHDRPAARFEGVPLGAILERAGVAMGPALRGPRLASYVVVDAADGYRVVFAIAELDSSFTNATVLLADRRNGAALPPESGPARLVVAGEKRPARWVRQVTRIRVVSASDAPAPTRTP